MQPKPPRPTGVTVLAVLAILGAIALLFSGAVLIGLGLLLGTLTASVDITSAITNAGYPGLASLGVGTISALVIALGAAILILGILYLMRPHVKVFFGKGTPMALRSAMPGTGSSTL